MFESIHYPDYWQQACDHLRRDPAMAALIARYPDSWLKSHGDAFYTLARAIVGQQVSIAAADAIWLRMEKALPDNAVHPQSFTTITDDVLRSAGLSRQKIRYLRALSDFFIQGQIHGRDHWQDMSDSAVIADITRITGIGRWSAEMFLIFCLLRPDVFPIDDIGLQRGMIENGLIRDTKPFPKARALEHARAWEPYRTVATWFLWRSIDPAEVQY